MIKKKGYAARGKGMNVALVNNPPYFVDDSEAEALHKWAINLKLDVGLHQFKLSDGQAVSVRVDSNLGDLREERYISDFELDERTIIGLYNKAKRVMDEQVLRKPVMRATGKKIAVFRWCIPNDSLLFSKILSDQLQQRLRVAYQNIEPDLEIHIFTNWDHQEDKPK